MGARVVAVEITRVSHHAGLKTYYGKRIDCDSDDEVFVDRLYLGDNLENNLWEPICLEAVAKVVNEAIEHAKWLGEKIAATLEEYESKQNNAPHPLLAQTIEFIAEEQRA